LTEKQFPATSDLSGEAGKKVNTVGKLPEPQPQKLEIEMSHLIFKDLPEGTGMLTGHNYSCYP